ncbi:hypothetical protein [Tsukamurella ocularis]|uniref:hypothetical protein n=1 Tax=Tsukamurella ocularis TaxID=1970234 RepID=UPI002166FEF8|nr:hypothetical protein [Tsukamurella ocularis]MCS3778369.1 hypothetical protein [Tsukamurella ocularis]MCS3789070.1 hypothetical protein [Tsukamurella ocularis]MCS3852921.1 hypothetical protein [Tsukamurella ocularis]
MEAFLMTTGVVTAAGTELGSLATSVAGAAGAGAVSAAALAQVFGLVGGDYLTELLGAVTATDAEVTRLAAFYTSASAGAARTVASAVATDAGGAGTLVGLLGAS